MTWALPSALQKTPALDTTLVIPAKAGMTEKNLRDMNRNLDTIPPDPPKIDVKRYRKVRRFFAKVFLHTIWWDIILNRPVLRLLRRTPLPRWKAISREYRSLAVEMGGVLIKLGQFLSIRVDILPSEVTKELAGLQDEVPPERTEEIIAQIEEDFGCPISDIFEWFSPEPLGAASLAQAHLAKIRQGARGEGQGASGERQGASGERQGARGERQATGHNPQATTQKVVVKVLRPGIGVLVETDLKAIRLAFRWLKHYKRVSRQVDLDWLAEEFTTVTRRELDFEAEGHNAERLARDLADEAYVYLPTVYWAYCASRTLTLENVGYIKIADIAAIDATGISRGQVADKLYSIYMKQVFETYFVHVDPHPGNLFVKPLPHPDEIEAGVTGFAPDDPVPHKPGRPFQLIFVDFGMSVTIPERLRSALREYAIGVGTHDAHKIVQSLVNAGTLTREADIKRLEEAHEALFRHLWGVNMGQMRNVALKEARSFLDEYKDVVYESPIQLQADLIFVMRAIGILSGMATNLDPDFDVWRKTIPYAERYAKEEFFQNKEDWLKEAATLGQLMLKIPTQLDSIVTQAERGRLTVQASLSPDTRKAIQRLEQSVNRLSWMVAGAGLLISGAILRNTGGDLLIALAALAFLWGMRKG